MKTKFFTSKGERTKAFTLAEVLITLAIIGVVAAMTIPTLISKYQKKQTISKLKKVYAAFSQAINMSIAENGPMQSWDTSDSYLFIQKYLYPYLKVVKDCGYSIEGECAHRQFTQLSSDSQMVMSSHPGFVLSDGTFVWVRIFSSGTGKWANVYIDINGKSTPNKAGKDFFVFIFSINNLGATPFEPAGMNKTREELISDEDYGCSKTATGHAGYYCAALILHDGWNISDDYPW